MKKEDGKVSAEGQGQIAENDRIFAEVQAQIAENKRKNEEYFAKTEHQIDEAEKTIKALKAIGKKNSGMWEKYGVKLGQNNGENPFIVLEKIAPEVFKGIGGFAEESRRAGLEEAELFGVSSAVIRKNLTSSHGTDGNELSSIIVAAARDGGDSKGKKSTRKKLVRRVRL
jgi:hypothetical protein